MHEDSEGQSCDATGNEGGMDAAWSTEQSRQNPYMLANRGFVAKSGISLTNLSMM